MERLILQNAQLLMPESIVTPATIVVDEGRIAYAGPAPGAPSLAGSRVNAGGTCVAPGLIDIHTHGGNSITFGTLATLSEDLHAYSAWVAASGVTGFLCSIAAPDAGTLLALVRAYAGVLDAGGFPGAEPLGLHLEGPYLNPERKGAFNETWLRTSSKADVRALLDAGRGWVRQMTLAPELPGATQVAAMLRSQGVVAALGHSNADFATASAALNGDFGHVTHTFNAQRGFHHREPGTLGAVLASDDVTAELIADAVHVHPGAMKVLLRCLGPDRVVLVSDAMAAAGLGDGEYTLAGNPVSVEANVARNPDGTIAGSTATLDQCVRNVCRLLDVPPATALRMASHNPARVLGLDSVLGSLDAGQQANLIALDEKLNVVATWVRGRQVHLA